ncbi:MAG: TauD/TfdA dioxygenase family protein [Acidimicrobiia bacterium]
MTATEVPLIPVPAAPAGHEYRSITVERHAGACGAVVGGVDLATELDDPVVAEIRRALLDHQVIFFRNQSLTPDEQVAFSRRFGPYSPVPFVEAIAGHAEVIAVVRDPSEQSGLVFGGLWHSDFSFLPEPPMGSILHAIEVPPYGADTIWANQYLAYRGLSRGMRGLVERVRGVHSAVNAYSPKMQPIHDMFAGMTVQTSDDANRAQEHPAVRIHAETAEPALFVNGQYTVGLAGFHPHESTLLLDHLFQHSTQHAYTCRWQWAAGDVAFWDNRCVQHMVMGDVTGHRRYMHRTTVAGEAPIAPPQ